MSELALTRTSFQVTTIFLALHLIFIKIRKVYVALPFLVFFGFIEGCFFTASLSKFVRGAYIPISVGIVLTLVMLFWTWGRHLEDNFEDKNVLKVRRSRLLCGKCKTSQLTLESYLSALALDHQTLCSVRHILSQEEQSLPSRHSHAYSQQHHRVGDRY